MPGEFKYLDITPSESEIARFKKIVPEQRGVFRKVHDGALAGIISSTMLNAHLWLAGRPISRAISREMKNEYQAIHRAGLLLQSIRPISPWTVPVIYRDLSDRCQFVKAVERHVAR